MAVEEVKPEEIIITYLLLLDFEPSFFLCFVLIIIIINYSLSCNCFLQSYDYFFSAKQPRLLFFRTLIMMPTFALTTTAIMLLDYALFCPDNLVKDYFVLLWIFGSVNHCLFVYFNPIQSH